MGMGPQDSRLKLTEAEEQHLLTLSHYEIAPYLHELEVAKGLRVPDAANPSVLHEITPLAEAAPKFRIKVAGQEFTADTLEELNAKYEPVLKAALAANQAAQHQDEPTRGSDGRFTKQPSITADADRIANSLVAKALKEELGIEPEELQASVASIRAERQYEGNWAGATKEFLKRNPDYSGNDETVRAIGDRMVEMGLDDKPSPESIQKAYESLAAEAERYLALKDAKTPEEIAAVLGIDDRRAARAQSALFGK